MNLKTININVNSGYISNEGGPALQAMGMGTWTKDEVQSVEVVGSITWPNAEVFCVARNDWGNINIFLSSYQSDVKEHFNGDGNRIQMNLSTDGEINEIDHNWVMWTRNPATAAGCQSAQKAIRDDN